jgi:hypothetical protein
MCLVPCRKHSERGRRIYSNLGGADFCLAQAHSRVRAVYRCRSNACQALFNGLLIPHA